MNLREQMQEKIAVIPENKWRIYTCIIGIVLGAIIALILLTMTGVMSGFLGMILVLAIGLWIPDYIERTFRRSVRLARIISLAATGVAGITFMIMRMSL